MATRYVRDDETYQRFFAYISESGLAPGMYAICVRHGVTIREIYLDFQGQTVHAARLEVWWWLLTECRKSQGEVGRIFDRAPTSITHGLKRLRERAAAMGKELAEDTVREVAVTVATEATNAKRNAGTQNLWKGNEAFRRHPGVTSSSEDDES